MRLPNIVAIGSVFILIGVACTQNSPSGKAKGTTRVMTYNIQWFSEDANPARIANLKSVLGHIAPDVVALQEIQSRAALKQVFGGDWQIGMADDPKEDQEVAIAVRRPNLLVGTEMVFGNSALDFAFPGKRDVLKAIIQTAGGKKLVVYVVHMKSRRGGRATTDAQRETACGLLAAYISGQKEDENVVVAGDFNDSPDDRSLNILETGDLRAEGGDNDPKKAMLVNLMQPLGDRDFVTLGMDSLFLGKDLTPQVKGAKADNARLRGKDYNYPADVNVPQTLMDQILASPALAAQLSNISVYGGADALRGNKGQVSVNEGAPTQYTEKGDQASDHLPVFADLTVL